MPEKHYWAALFWIRDGYNLRPATDVYVADEKPRREWVQQDRPALDDFGWRGFDFIANTASNRSRRRAAATVGASRKLHTG